MDFDQMVEQYHQALEEFTKADPKPVTALFSQRDDVTLARGTFKYRPIITWEIYPVLNVDESRTVIKEAAAAVQGY